MTLLKKSFSLFFYAFKECGDCNVPVKLTEENTIWETSEITPEVHVFFNHVQDFFNKNKGNLTTIDPSCCISYKLKQQHLNENQKDKLFLLNQFFSKPTQIAGGYKEKIMFKFINDGSILSPHIFYHPLTRIGILTYSIELIGDSNTMENLMEINYSTRNFSTGSDVIFYTPVNTHPSAEEQERKITQKLSELRTVSTSHTFQEEMHGWTLENYITTLLHELPADSLLSLSPRRVQCFTYAQVVNKVEWEELQLFSFRLRRVYNKHYLPSKDYLSDTTEVYHAFEQINIGGSIEGCAIIINGNQDQLPEFIKQYDAVIKNRMLWSYILAYFQRLALIDMNKKLSSLYDHGSPNKEILINAIADLSKIQLRSFFTQVSYFSQQNEFFDFCKNNLKLNEMLIEVKDKLSDIQRIVEQQQIEAEKENEKRKEGKERIIEIMIAALLIPQILFEFLSALAESLGVTFFIQEKNIIHYILLALSVILLLTLGPFGFRIYKEYYGVIKTFFKKRDS